MIALALVAFALAAAVAAVMMPYEAMRTSHALGRRADGTDSHTRTSREAVHRRRAWRAGFVWPVVLVAAVALGGVLVDVYTPWTRLATVFGTSTSETALLSETQVQRVREQEAVERIEAQAAEEAARASGVRMARHRSRSVGAFLMDHFPLRPLWLLLLGGALWRLARVAAAANRDYEHGMRTRQREYMAYDLVPHERRPETAAHGGYPEHRA